MTKLNRLILIAVLGLSIAACQSEKKTTGGTADGEILSGSASDAMLPLDSVRSQAPLAPHSDKPKDAAKDGASDAAKADSSKPEETIDQAPAAEPTPEAPAE